MEERNEKVIRVVLRESELNSLITILNHIIEADDSPDHREGNMAKMIRDSILKYKKPCRTTRSTDGKGFKIFFLESEAALMIQYFGIIADLFLNQ